MKRADVVFAGCVINTVIMRTATAALFIAAVLTAACGSSSKPAVVSASSTTTASTTTTAAPATAVDGVTIDTCKPTATGTTIRYTVDAAGSAYYVFDIELRDDDGLLATVHVTRPVDAGRHQFETTSASGGTGSNAVGVVRCVVANVRRS